MIDANLTVNAVAAIRVSSVKQGLQGDSPDDQRQQIERFAKARNINVKKYFVFMESASKVEQPVQEAINYCKDPNNDVQLFIIKSIDRFTRGGSYFYDHLKMQLDNVEVQLLDIYGVIGNQSVNTLEHLGVEYSWSKYNPTKKAEMLEAERAKDEMRDIMTRMIGAEIRYVRMGYSVRQAPYGYKNDKVETEHGKRNIYIPDENEAHWIRKMFNLRSQGNMTDREIVKKLNELGFKTRRLYKRDPKNRTRIVGQLGEKKLTLKQFDRYIQKPIYAGITVEKWTNGIPVDCKFRGLVSIELFNKANRGRLVITQKNGKIEIHKRKLPIWQAKKNFSNPDYPYRRHVLCPQCKNALYGSASRGKLGKYYPAYHCNKKGHYFRVPIKKFEKTLREFVSERKVSPEYVEKLKALVLKLWDERIEKKKSESDGVEEQIQELQMSANAIMNKIRVLNSESAIKFLEQDLEKVEGEIKTLSASILEPQEEADITEVMEIVGYYLEHMEELVFSGSNKLKNAECFRVMFNDTPTYEDLVSGTPNLVGFIAENVVSYYTYMTSGGR